jgi:uncharacterized protein (TIGR00159 family)
MPIDAFSSFAWGDLIDILIVSFILHRLFLLLRGTTALQVMLGLLLLWFFEAIANAAGFLLTSWLFRGIGAVAVLAIVVVFRSELREIFLKSNPIRFFFGRQSKLPQVDIPAIVESAFHLAKARTGAIIVLQRGEPLDAHLREGSDLDGKVSPGVIESIFSKQSPLHDGAIVIRGNRIGQIGTFLPLTQQEGLPARYGTRHRAALGLAEVSDAAVLVVSEERGQVSLVEGGEIRVVEDALELTECLERLLLGSPSEVESGRGQSWWSYATGLALTCLVVAAVWGLYTGGELSLINMTVPIDFRNIPEELVLKEVTTETVEVQISGKQQLIANLGSEQVRAFLDLKAEKPGIHPLSLNQENIEIPFGLEVMRISPTTVTLELEERVQRAILVQPRFAEAVVPGYRWKLLEVIPESVQLIGPRTELDGMKALFTEAIDWAGTDPSIGEVAIEAPVVLSGSVRLAAGEPRRVQLRIQFQPDSGQADALAVAYHVVQPGETLWGLSRHYGLTVNELRKLNDLSQGTPIRPGQKLKVGTQ